MVSMIKDMRGINEVWLKQQVANSLVNIWIARKNKVYN